MNQPKTERRVHMLAREASAWPVVGPATLQLRAAARLLRRRPPGAAVTAALDERVVFVLGSPRSGTTFLAGALGSLPGFVDLGEVLPLKAAVPTLARLGPEQAAIRVRRMLWLTRRLSGLGGVRAVEQTPEAAFLGRALPLAFPDATILHLVRDGRDVVASLLERGWLSTKSTGRDDAGNVVGAAPRFWVEAGREEEFAAASEARRAAWAWRRYVEGGRGLGASATEMRYERICRDPEGAAGELAALLEAPEHELQRALRGARAGSIGRFRGELTPAQLADVEVEAGELLVVLGYE
jgi:hypothetical protein